MRTSIWVLGGGMAIALALSAADASAPAPTAVPAPEGADGGCPAGQTINVSMVDREFVPEQVSVAVGDSIKWTMAGGIQHSSTEDFNGYQVPLFAVQGVLKQLDPPVWDSGIRAIGQTFTFQFCGAGTFTYHCDVHTLDMTGQVTVA